jgi:hypothetical protein
MEKPSPNSDSVALPSLLPCKQAVRAILESEMQTTPRGVETGATCQANYSYDETRGILFPALAGT